MAMGELVLVSNPGSSSRKYGVYKGKECVAKLHFEHVENRIVCTVTKKDGSSEERETDLHNMEDAMGKMREIFKDLGIEESNISAVAVRVVAPSSHFLNDVELDDHNIGVLRELMPAAPLHIKGTLEEAEALKSEFPEMRIFGISDSNFHAAKPSRAWNYGIPIHDADRFNIKRFGYHGLSLGSVARELNKQNKLAEKVIVCHIGSGVSVTALLNGESQDNTMGFSPLDGVTMATRSGSIDVVAYNRLKALLNFDDDQMYSYLNQESGLKGLSGVSPDIRDLLKQEEYNPLVQLALETYVYNIQKAIGQMASALNGVDVLVFSGTVGERSHPIRERIISQLGYLGFVLDTSKNNALSDEGEIQAGESKKIFVVPAQEELEMACRVEGNLRG